MQLFLAGMAVGAILCVLILIIIRYFVNGEQSGTTKVEQWMRHKRILSKGSKIVALGGGTGLATLLRGLKQYTSNITAVVTVADDGGSSGKIREDLGIIPPGDIRNCILALADVEPAMERLMQYRFKDGSLKGQNLGNLLIAAMTDISGGPENAIKEISSVLAVTGRVLPVSLDNIHLVARLEDGTIVRGESKIPMVQMEKNSSIQEVSIDNPNCKTPPEVLKAINDAETVILGPGSLYTSIIPNILVKEVAQAIRQCNAIKIYVCNIMMQPGETTGYSVAEHVKAIIKHGGPNIIDYVLVNNKRIPSHLLEKYKQQQASPVSLSCLDTLKDMNVKVIQSDLADFSMGLIRHNPRRLAREIMELICRHNKENEMG
jgi:uncharacterized cofD-like protein